MLFIAPVLPYACNFPRDVILMIFMVNWMSIFILIISLAKFDFIIYLISQRWGVIRRHGLRMLGCITVEWDTLKDYV